MRAAAPCGLRQPGSSGHAGTAAPPGTRDRPPPRAHPQGSAAAPAACHQPCVSPLAAAPGSRVGIRRRVQFHVALHPFGRFVCRMDSGHDRSPVVTIGPAETPLRRAARFLGAEPAPPCAPIVVALACLCDTDRGRVRPVLPARVAQPVPSPGTAGGLLGERGGSIHPPVPLPVAPAPPPQSSSGMVSAAPGPDLRDVEGVVLRAPGRGLLKAPWPPLVCTASTSRLEQWAGESNGAHASPLPTRAVAMRPPPTSHRCANENGTTPACSWGRFSNAWQGRTHYADATCTSVLESRFSCVKVVFRSMRRPYRRRQRPGEAPKITQENRPPRGGRSSSRSSATGRWWHWD